MAELSAGSGYVVAARFPDMRHDVSSPQDGQHGHQRGGDGAAYDPPSMAL